jgi:hypothetical protein
MVAGSEMDALWMRATRHAGWGLYRELIADQCGKVFPGSSPRAPKFAWASANPANEFLILLIQGESIIYRRQGEEVSLAGLPFQANPTVEIHGA